MSAVTRAEAYDRHTGRYGPELSAAFVRFAGIEAGMRVLDVGCGTGALTARLAHIVGGDRVLAVDPSEAYADACRRRVPGAAVRVGSAEALPFEDGGFDAVVSQLVIQALDDAPAAARELRRVAAPGGVWTEAGIAEVHTVELSAGAGYDDFDDAWFSFASGAGVSGAYCRSLDDRRRGALRDEFRRRLGAPGGPFRLDARAWAVRGAYRSDMADQAEHARVAVRYAARRLPGA